MKMLVNMDAYKGEVGLGDGEHVKVMFFPSRKMMTNIGSQANYKIRRVR